MRQRSWRRRVLRTASSSPGLTGGGGRCTGPCRQRVAVGWPFRARRLRGALAAVGLDRLLAVFDRLEDALPDGDPPLEPGCPGLAQA